MKNYQKFHHKNTIYDHPRHSASIETVTDTGCQSCLAGTNLLKMLGLSTKSLIPVNTRMQSADSESIELLGAMFIELSGYDDHGELHKTKQMVYISKNTNNFYLNRGGCEALGIISNKFPKIGEHKTKYTASAITLDKNSVISTDKAPCGCPKRTAPPPITKPPCELVEGNREEIENFLKEHYKSSTLNTCVHQILPEMHGPPMKLMVDRTAKPVAFQKAIPVPIHFQDPVKEGLDNDECLGVIERVPAGTPTTWIHRMIIYSKKG